MTTNHLSFGQQNSTIALLVTMPSLVWSLACDLRDLLAKFNGELEKLLSTIGPLQSANAAERGEAARVHERAARALCLASCDLRVRLGRYRVSDEVWSWVSELFSFTAAKINPSIGKAHMYRDHLVKRAQEVKPPRTAMFSLSTEHQDWNVAG